MYTNYYVKLWKENIVIREMNGETDHVHVLFDYAPDIKLIALVTRSNTELPDLQDVIIH